MMQRLQDHKTIFVRLVTVMDYGYTTLQNHMESRRSLCNIGQTSEEMSHPTTNGDYILCTVLLTRAPISQHRTGTT